MIEQNARRLEATRALPFKPLALDFAKLVAERRADRVGAHVRREATNRHADDIQQRVTAENQRNERERIGKALQVGVVPAHFIPQVRGIVEGAEDAVPIPVEIIDPRTGCVKLMGVRGPDGTARQGRINNTVASRQAAIAPFTEDEVKVAAAVRGAALRESNPEHVATRNVKARAMNAIALEGFQTPPRRA